MKDDSWQSSYKVQVPKKSCWGDTGTVKSSTN